MGIVESAVQSVLDPVLDVVKPVIEPLVDLVEAPATAILPQSEEAFKLARQLLGTGSEGKSPDAALLDKLPKSVRDPLQQAVAHVDNLANTKPSRKQERMMRALELFCDALEAEEL